MPIEPQLLAFAALLLVGAVTACGEVTNDATKTATGGTGATGATGGGTGGGVCGSSAGASVDDIGPWASCPHADPAAMVQLPEGYSIDTTEVTIAQYQAWLRTGPSTNSQIPFCCWNTSFVPLPRGVVSPDCGSSEGCCNHPVVHVDWCDAYAYCQGVGKRLCGKIGGGPNGYDDYADPTLSQWYNACSSHGANTYVYGNTYDPEACNTEGEPRNVPSSATCQSPLAGYQGVYDLTGNAMEWEDSCEESSGFCRLSPGSSANGAVAPSALTCAFNTSLYLSFTLGKVGFRCCSR
jgi:formylglycine-generating enzyme required for sulfatase activity